VPDASDLGTASPLRGLSSFAESDRELFFGRDRERKELAALVTGDGFRAGLFYGEAGTGKTSLLRAGLQNDLRDQGVFALYCENNAQPIESFAQALSQASGHTPNEGEKLTTFLSRVIGDSQRMYVLILDDIDLVMSTSESVPIALAELFTRVVSRSAGRARFLFACASDRVHRFAALEQRTGSLFPPSSRYELPRMQTSDAIVVLQQMMMMVGMEGQDELPQSIVEQLSQDALILPAELQIAALSLRQEGITSPREVSMIGGYAELERRWITSAAASTGNERAAMRLLAQLAGGPPGRACLAPWAAARAGIEAAFASEALAVLQTRGLVLAYPVPGSEELQYTLAHEVLAPRVREQSAPARLSAQHAFDALGSKAAQDKPLSPMEYLEVRREGIVPTTPQEQAILDRTRLLGKIALGAIAAFPVLIVIIAYTMMSGAYYLDTAYSKEGIETIVVRAGRPSMSWFNWLPKSPEFGSLVADTGLTERMVSEKEWRLASDNDRSGDLDGDEYAKQARSALTPRLANLVDYAQRGEASSLTALQAAVQNSDDFTHLLRALRPIARASAEEGALVATALKDPSAAVQTEALMLAAAAATRKSGNYDELLTGSLASADSEHRRLTFSVVRNMNPAISNRLYQRALDQSSDPAAKRELRALLAGAGSKSSASAASATSLLLSGEVSDVTRARAHAILTRAFETNAITASADAAKLLGNESAAVVDRLLAITLLLEYAPPESLPGLSAAVEAALKSTTPRVQAAALPLSARINPGQVAGDLATLAGQMDTLSPDMQIAVATAWGQVAKMDEGNRDVARVALEKMLKSQKRGLRGAAARAYGYTGRTAQADLIKMIKTEFIDVAEHAAYGLANTTESGASVANAIGGVRDMWRRKGRMRRIAAEVYTRLARTMPGPAYFYVSASSRAADDSSLHPIGMRGICNSLKAGNHKVGKDLARAASDSQVEVRRIAIQCVVDYPKVPAVSVQVAAAMVSDSNADIRAESARVLAKLAEQGERKEIVGATLIKMTSDESRDVRVIAVGALASLGADAPTAAVEALPGAFDRGDEAEKLAILKTAEQIGATELVQRGIADASPLVRIAALDTSIATKTDISAILNSALTDSDNAVRSAALERLSEGKHGLAKSDVTQALALAVRDKDPAISDLAMMINAQVGDPAAVSEQLGRSLQSRSEETRARAATASLGLVAQSPKIAIELLTPLLKDPSHDVRVAMLSPLAEAYAKTMSAEELRKRLHKSEARANQRIVTVAAFLSKAAMEGERDAVVAQLEKTAASGPALAKLDAALALELLSGSADGLAFLRLLVP
jgi:hypothetical protein